ncbi:MAG: acyl-CoA thioesterase [Myxococcaceae bacterium]|nr:acyl-CoA thioesterase [Myxococcaceae bacterium]
MAYEQRRTVRFEEVDFAQLVYFPRLFGFCHQTFEDFFRDEVGVPYAVMLQKRRVGYPTVHAEADFRAPLRFGDEVAVVMDTVKVGTRSISSRYRLFLEPGRSLCATVQIVTVAMSMDTYRSVDLPTDVRAAFERHLATAEEL